MLDPQLLATWLAFWSLTKSDPAVGALHGELYAEFRLGLEALLRDCQGAGVGQDTLRLQAIAITALVDGLWLELCLDQRGPFTPAEAERLALGVLDGLLAGPG